MVVCVDTDLMVLAIFALKIAIGKENITNAITSAYRGLFAPVYTNGRNIKTSSGFAITIVLFKPVGLALPGTDIAII
jgi:hypothetical protein